MKFDTSLLQDLFGSTQPVLLPDGDYLARVIDAQEQVSKSGNEMIKITLEIKQDNSRHIIYDYLLDKFVWKISSFCKATDLMKKFEAGELRDKDCKGKMVKVTVIQKRGELKDKNNPESDRYKDSNAIKSYSKASLLDGMVTIEDYSKKEPDINMDDIPF